MRAERSQLPSWTKRRQVPSPEFVGAPWVARIGNINHRTGSHVNIRSTRFYRLGGLGGGGWGDVRVSPVDSRAQKGNKGSQKEILILGVLMSAVRREKVETDELRDTNARS